MTKALLIVLIVVLMNRSSPRPISLRLSIYLLSTVKVQLACRENYHIRPLNTLVAVQPAIAKRYREQAQQAQQARIGYLNQPRMVYLKQKHFAT